MFTVAWTSAYTGWKAVTLRACNFITSTLYIQRIKISQFQYLISNQPLKFWINWCQNWKRDSERPTRTRIYDMALFNTETKRKRCGSVEEGAKATSRCCGPKIKLKNRFVCIISGHIICDNIDNESDHENQMPLHILSCKRSDKNKTFPRSIKISLYIQRSFAELESSVIYKISHA